MGNGGEGIKAATTFDGCNVKRNQTHSPFFKFTGDHMQPDFLEGPAADAT